jgi:regulation of enolase protein 1 (concanavalin A-like superfamily)
MGSAGVSNLIYTVKGAGTISGTADHFRFMYQSLSGDGEIKVRLNSADNTGTEGRIGVMIRESLAPGSQYVFMGVSSDGTFLWQRRSKTGGLDLSTTSSGATPPDVWMRLVRIGETLYGYRYTDGTNWTQVNSRRIPMASSIYIGIAVASGSSNTLNTSTFTSVTVVP